MYSAVIFSLSVLSLFHVTDGITVGPKTGLKIVNADISPDGFNRSSVLAGGTLPGWIIRGKKGDRFELNVVDALTDERMLRSTSIHWHGIHQKRTNWADGAASVTQCPISPGHSFLYDFSVTAQAGTYWYHSHYSTQYCDGLRGAFIVDDPLDRYNHLYDVDDESTVISLVDWYHVYAAHELGAAGPLTAATILINGRGRYKDGPPTALSVVNVRHGKRYRFRIISMMCDPNVIFSIDRHTLEIIEVDGEYTLPHTVDSIQIFAGQRYSVVFRANRKVGNYWIRANPNGPGVPGFDGGRNLAILRYHGAPAADPTNDPTTLVKSLKPLKETDLHPRDLLPLVPGLPWVGGADIVLNIKHGFNFSTFQFVMNGASFLPPSVPVLLQILSGAQAAQDLLPKGSVYTLPPNKVIELSLPGSDAAIGGPHPFHLHGHTFSVIRSAGSEEYNFFNPVRRDTVNTGLSDSNMTIRFKTDNAGPWFLHCHIDWHLELGLAVVFAEDTGHTKQNDPVPDAWKNLCPVFAPEQPI